MKPYLKVNIKTLGCDKNLVDSEIMLGLLDKNRFEISNKIEDSDIVIINTCGFIQDAKEESIDAIIDIAEYKKNSILKIILVAGCLSQRYRKELLDEMPEIDGLIGTNEYDQINELIELSLEGKRPNLKSNTLFSYEDFLPKVSLTPNHYSYIKIAEGCNNLCTFCSIPSIRGAFRSRSIESIINEAEIAVRKGTKEIILVAQDTSYYGKDNYGKLMLSDLINELSKIDDLSWIRVHYLYPGNINDDLIDTYTNNDKLCKYIDMPIQHSEEHILKKMLRPHHQKDIKKLLKEIRKKVPNITLRTTIMVGFPGETLEDYNKLIEFIKEVKFDRLGVFIYSDEEDTAASNLNDKVPLEEKERRAQYLMKVQNEISTMRNSNLIGKEIDVLIDRYDEHNDIYIGRTQYDAPEIDGEVFISNIKTDIGKIIKVKITHSYDYDLVGEGILK